MSPVLMLSRLSSQIHNYINKFVCYETARNLQRHKSTTPCGPTSDDRKECILPPEPQNCCMSGCSNCVWIKYAEEVSKIIDDGGEVAKAKILENVKDPNLRAFLMIEVAGLYEKKKDK